MTSSLTVASKNSSSSTASCCSCFSASNAISCCQWLKHDIWEYIDALDQVSCCQRLFPNRSKFVWRITSGGMPNRAVVKICTSAIHGWIQNLIRNKSVYDCYRQSLIFGKIKNSLTNTADVLEFSKTSNFVMAISQEVSEIWKNVSYQIYRAEKNNMWTSVWKTKKNMILALKYAYVLLMVSGTVTMKVDLGWLTTTALCWAITRWFHADGMDFQYSTDTYVSAIYCQRTLLLTLVKLTSVGIQTDAFMCGQNETWLSPAFFVLLVELLWRNYHSDDHLNWFSGQATVLKKSLYIRDSASIIMSADVATFFANKKRKKPFKFNANLIDSTSMAQATHVYVP